MLSRVLLAFGANAEQSVASLDFENSKIMDYLTTAGNRRSMEPPPSLPHISLPVSFSVVISALVMNPLSGVHLPRSTWMLLDVLIIALLAYAWTLLSKDLTGQRPHTELEAGPNGSPILPLYTQSILIVKLKQL